jgi:hypothetical protein
MSTETKPTLHQVVAELAAAFESDKREPYELRALKAAHSYIESGVGGSDLRATLENAIREGEEARATFYRICDTAPAWIKQDYSLGNNLMNRAHEALDDRLPDDWVYEIAAHVAEAFTEYDFDTIDELRDKVSEIADSEIDVYNSDRLQWLASHLGNADLVDTAVQEFGYDNSTGIVGAIGIGQYYAIERIAGALIDAIEAEVEKRDAQ